MDAAVDAQLSTSTERRVGEVWGVIWDSLPGIFSPRFFSLAISFDVLGPKKSPITNSLRLGELKA